MWFKVSGIILRNKILLLTILAVITIFFGYHARKVEMSYSYASMLPKKDQAFKDYQKFIEIFGEEGNLIINVRDTGVGMSGAELEQVYQRFWRADPARSRTGQRAGQQAQKAR